MSGVALVTSSNHVPSPSSVRRTSNPISNHPSTSNLNESQLLTVLPTSHLSNGMKSPNSTLHHQTSNYDLSSELEDQYLGTGYAVASRKRNFDFHSIFKSIPQDDYLIEDYGCALQRDILVQGRLYISEQHLCFNANIFGWVTTLVLPFSDVVSIEKKMTALIIPNAIQVMTMQSRHTFASFISRDVTYDLMTNIWRISHPTIPTHNNSSSISLNPAIGNDEVHVEYLGPSSSNTTTDPNSTSNSNPTSTTNSNATNPSTTMTKVPELTTCACLGTDAHYKDVALDTTYNTSLENLYQLLFMNSHFMISFWENDQRLTGKLFKPNLSPPGISNFLFLLPSPVSNF
ncbi:GRAM domain-containing protein [Melampsora americana]|nr:GRAM domain-containing protein [Melampsora americana]